MVTRQVAKSKFYRINPDSELVDPARTLVQKFNMLDAGRVAGID
jgi:hypothetical protein